MIMDRKPPCAREPEKTRAIVQGVAECAGHAHLLFGILVFFGVGLRVVLDHSFDVL